MFLRQNSNNVEICCLDMDILLWSSASCFNLFLMMVMAGSTGTNVNRTFSSKEMMHSPSPNLMFLTCSTKSCMFLM